MGDDRDSTLPRRRLLGLLGAGAIGSVAGCSGDDGSTSSEPTETETPESTPTQTETPEPTPRETPEPTPPDTPTPTETPTPTPEQEPELPDEIDEETWNQITDEIGEDRLIAPLTQNNEFTQPGIQAARILTSQGQEHRRELADAIAALAPEENGAGRLVDQSDIGILRSYVENPSLPAHPDFRSVFADHGLARVDGSEYPELTDQFDGLARVEYEGIFGFDGGLAYAVPQYLPEIRAFSLEDGYDEQEAAVLNALGTYLTTTINGFAPRIQQVMDEGFIQRIHSQRSIRAIDVDDIVDQSENGLIPPNDPAPGQYSASNDKFGSGVQKYVLQVEDLRSDISLNRVRVTRDAEREKVLPALQNSVRALSRGNINALFFKGNFSLDPISEEESVIDYDEIEAKMENLGMHNITFAKNALGEDISGLNWNIGDHGNYVGIGHAVINTEYSQETVNVIALHEIASILGGYSVPWHDKEVEGKGRRSILSYGGPQEILEEDFEAIRDENLATPSEPYRSDLQELLAEGRTIYETDELYAAPDHVLNRIDASQNS